MTAKKKKASLPLRILFGMALGIITGAILHHCLPGQHNQSLIIQGLAMGGSIFLNLFRMIVVPVVLFSMMRGVMSMNNPALLGRVGVKTLVLFVLTTVASSLLALAAAYGMGIGKGTEVALPENSNVRLEGSIQSIQETLSTIVPSNMFKSVVDANMLQVIFIAVLAGYAITLSKEKLPILVKLVDEIDTLNIKIVELIMAVAPFGVFCLLGHTFSDFGIAVLLPLAKYILCIVLCIAVLLCVIYPLLLKCLAGCSPILFYRKFFSVMLLAFSTSSSNATLPNNIEVTSRKLGVSQRLATFILSLGSTINMNGTAIMQACAAVLIAQLYGKDLNAPQLIQIVFTSLVASIGTAGMPSAGVIMLGLVLESVGLPLSGIALILGVDRIIDMFRTVANITGDTVTTLVVAASEKELDRETFDSHASVSQP